MSDYNSDAEFSRNPPMNSTMHDFYTTTESAPAAALQHGHDDTSTHFAPHANARVRHRSASPTTRFPAQAEINGINFRHVTQFRGNRPPTNRPQPPVEERIYPTLHPFDYEDNLPTQQKSNVVNTPLKPHYAGAQQQQQHPQSHFKPCKLKINPPKLYVMGDCFRTFRLILLNYMRDSHDISQQRAILLSLLDPKIFAIAHPVVSEGSSIEQILDELQSLFSPEDEIATKLTTFQNLKQIPGESINQYGLRIADKGYLAHPNLAPKVLQAYLVAQFVSGLIDSNLKNTIRLLGPNSLQQAILLVKRTQIADSSPISISTVAVEPVQPQSTSITCQLCQMGNHIASQCRKFNVQQRKANPNGFTSTYSNNQFNDRRQTPTYKPRYENYNHNSHRDYSNGPTNTGRFINGNEAPRGSSTYYNRNSAQNQKN